MNEETNKSTYEQKKAEREKEKSLENKALKAKQNGKRLIIFLVVIAVLIGIAVIVKVWGQSLNPTTADLSVFYKAQSRDHITVGSTHDAYSSNPPTGGWHYALPAREKFYTEPLADEYLVHNLEHGDIWIAYSPTLPDAVKDALKKIAGSKVIITPRSGNPTDISLVAWERLDNFNLENNVLPQDRINDFIKRYKDQGPEKFPPGTISQTFN